ncbi:hypothetical protein NMK34_10370 [Micromonospora sp. BRA006-A]|uniref:hypothetical protein n=1 Tax=Micromonospora sp. BRA006-A TaxID=2962860 RepID=UPI00296E9C65|nr:hypothetical protein [Micromonospora sp. BRA006-A]MDW3847007.1 hypothetical protein [Micromonospora sp. BRA006-A]
MDAFVSQLPALLGVVVGALGTGLVTFLSTRSQWKRGQSVRWDERRLEAYGEFAQVLKEIQAISLRVLAAADGDKYRSGLDKAAALPRLADADIRHTLAWERLLLLGDAATVAAAQDWREAVWRLEHRAREVGETTEPLTDVYQQANACRDRFYDAARRGLGVSGGSVAQSDRLQQRLASPENHQPTSSGS